MRRSVWSILAGLMLAIFGAAAVAKISGLPLSIPKTGEAAFVQFLRTVLPIAAFALPGALTAILLAEARRVRGLLFWVFAGAVLGALAYLTLPKVAADGLSAVQSPRALMTLLGMGGIGGWLYWWAAGRKSGVLAAAIARASQDHHLDEKGLHKRCRVCTAMTLLLGLLPLALIGWHLAYKPGSLSPAALMTEAEAMGTQRLIQSGLPAAKFSIDNHIGRISGTAADEAARTATFSKAKTVLAPMVGLPGVVAYLQNDIRVPDVAPAAKPVVADAVAGTRKIKPAKPADEKRLSAEAKRKAADTAAKAKAAEEERTATEAKRTADEAAAKARAIEEERALAAAKRKAEQELAAQAKNAEEALNAAKAKQRAEDEKRLTEDLAVQRKADEEKRVAAEAQAERAAVEAARKAAAAEKVAAADLRPATVAPKAAPEAPPRPPVATPAANCAADFSDVFLSSSVRFGLRSAALDKPAVDALDRIAAVTKRCAGYSVAIGGHADRTGSAAANAKMSESRALAVRDALVKRGIEAPRLIARGYGNQRPFDPANTRAAYSLNRRVDFGAALTPAPKSAGKAAAAASATVPMAAAIAAWPVAQCATEFSRFFRSEKIRFTGASAIVADSYADYLDGLARIALSCPAHKLSINGHTDRRGRAAYNQALSQERANAVRDALIDRDVPDTQLVANGYGGKRPFYPAKSRAAYAFNRRVDFGISLQSPTAP